MAADFTISQPGGAGSAALNTDLEDARAGVEIQFASLAAPGNVWTLTDKPDASSASLGSPTSQVATLTADVNGEYLVTLTQGGSSRSLVVEVNRDAAGALVEYGLTTPARGRSTTGSKTGRGAARTMERFRARVASALGSVSLPSVDAGALLGRATDAGGAGSAAPLTTTEIGAIVRAALATVTSAVGLNGQRLTGVGVPSGASDAATKGYVDTSAVPPLVPDFSEPADAAGRNGTYTSAGLVHTSTIDPSHEMTCTTVFNAGVAAAHVSAGTKMPILLLLHGYSGTAGSWGDTERLLAADKGYFVIGTTKRGNASSPHSAGGADDARDRQDIVDAIAAAVAARPTFLDGACVDILGVSGGSYDAQTLITRYPGRFRNVVATQLGPDLGVSPEADRSYWGTDDNRTEVEARVGSRASDLQPYRARNALTSLVSAMRQSTTKLFLLWDAQDSIGITLRSARDALAASDVPRSRWYAEESDTGDARRWEHGYPATVPALLDAIHMLAHRIDDPAPVAAETGEYIVTGHCVSAAGWECWTADTGATDCKYDATGGREHVVRVVYDRKSAQFLVEPMSGPCAVSMVADGLVVTQDIT